MNDLLSRMQEKFSTLTNSQRKVANYVGDHLNSLAFLTLDELAYRIGVSTTTVIRFARTLGYSGYSDMQQAIRTALQGKSSLPERYREATRHVERDQLLMDSFHTDLDNIQQTLTALDPALLKASVDAIVAAKRVYLLGMRGAFSLSHMMASRLGQIKEDVRLIQAVGALYPEEVNGADEGDVCIAFMFPRYAKLTASLVSFFKKRGTRVIIITGTHDAPVRTYGDLILPCAIQSVSFKSSYAAPVCLIHYLVAAVALELPDAKDVLSRTEEMLSQGYYLGL